MTAFAGNYWFHFYITTLQDSNHKLTQWNERIKFRLTLEYQQLKWQQLPNAGHYATHKHPDVRKWLARHKRFHMHFTPTSSSWLNVIERWFRDLTENRLRRGVFKSVPELIEAIMAYIAEHNENPKTFQWTAKAEDILVKVTRSRNALINHHLDDSLH